MNIIKATCRATNLYIYACNILYLLTNVFTINVSRRAI